MRPRSSRPEVRNPILALPASDRLRTIDPETRSIIHGILLELQADARGRAEESWRRHKAPMAAYWKAVSVYAGHIARALNTRSTGTPPEHR